MGLLLEPSPTYLPVHVTSGLELPLMGEYSTWNLVTSSVVTFYTCTPFWEGMVFSERRGYHAFLLLGGIVLACSALFGVYLLWAMELTVYLGTC